MATNLSIIRIWPSILAIAVISGLGMETGFGQQPPPKEDATMVRPGIFDLPTGNMGNSPNAIQDSQAIEDLNPIFLQIALGTVREDTSILLQCIKDLDKAVEIHPLNKIPAGFAKLVIYEQIPDAAAYVEQLAQIVEWPRGEVDEVRTIWKRLNLFTIKLAEEKREDWIDSAIKRAGPRIWPGADATTVWVAQRFAPTLAGYSAQSDYLNKLQSESKKLCEDESYPTELRTLWLAGRQDLSKLSVELHASHFAFAKLWSELQAYLEEFGSEGQHSRHLFSLAIHTLNRARSQKVDFDSATIPPREWFDRWHVQMERGGSAKVAKRLSEVWVVFDAWKDEPLLLGRVSTTELIRDPQLRASFSGQFNKPTLRAVLDQASKETGVSLRVGPTTDPELIIASSITFSGPLHTAMRIIAEQKTARGEWERTEDGYVLHSSQKNPAEGLSGLAKDLSTSRLVLIAVNLAVVGLVIRWIVSNRRTSSEAVSSTTGHQPTSNSENASK